MRHFYFIFKYFNSILLVIILINTSTVSSSLSDYLNGISRYFRFKQDNVDEQDLIGEFAQTIPYEVSAVDEKFISEAIKLTGVAVSELDMCQQRVVLKLKTDCHKMNDEQLAKVAVHLLNCQSYVEGRTIYPCTEEMSIKECTINMDSDTWTSYHLMSNRARAVCYMIRQAQFRGLAEQTVNHLMEASKYQLKSLGMIADNQENIKSIAENTYDTLSKAHENLSAQQKNMEKAQFHGQLVLENNIMRLVDEKRLIHETHNKLIEMTKEVQNKLKNSVNMLQNQNHESSVNHKQLLEDIAVIQARADDLFDKIDTYSKILLQQNTDFKTQYESTLKNLQEVNKTVHTLVVLVGGTRQALEERLSWILTALGGTDHAIDKLYLVLCHIGFTLISMLICAFLSARLCTRIIVAVLPPVNLAVALYGHEYLSFLSLCGIFITFFGGQTLISAINSKISKAQSVSFPKMKSDESFVSTKSQDNVSKISNDSDNYDNQEANETDHFNNEFPSFTPPLSRNGHYTSVRSRSRSSTPLIINTSMRGPCHARTRAGTPCKLNSLPGRDYCYRHQSGDSVMG